MTTYHSLECLCPRCLLVRLRNLGASLSMIDGEIVAKWPTGFPPHLKAKAREHRDAIVSLLAEEAAFEVMTGCPKLAQALAICARSSRPEAKLFADLLVSSEYKLTPRLLELGLQAAEAIQGLADLPIEGEFLRDAAVRVLEA